jgi:PAS domain S-box-containing protein
MEAPVNTALLDLDGRFVAVSAHYVLNQGTTADKILGRSVFELVPGSDAAVGKISEMLAAGHEKHTVVREITLGGHNVWYQSQASYWHDDDGNVCGYLIFNQNVTREHEADQRRRRVENLLRAVLDNIPGSVAIQDFDTGEFLLVNKGASESAGMTTEQMVGRRASELFPDRVVDYATSAGPTVDDNGIAITEFELKHGDMPGQIMRLKRIVFEDDAGRKRLLSVGEDVTDLRRATKALEAAVAEATAANAAKSNFLANVSHEIRTPLNGVLGMAQSMAQNELSPAQQKRLDIIRQSGQTLLTLLNDLLDVSKIESGKLELETIEFELAQTIETAYALFTAIAEQKGLEFQIDVEGARGFCQGDPTRLRQVISNLISNALKFTARGKIGVVATREGDDVRVAVTDTGTGMAPETLGKLFDKFVQADTSTTRKYGGTGLGLAICRDLVALMGGSLSVESTPDKGSCFSFTVPLPRVRRDAAEPNTALARPVRSGPLRILAAEDNPINQRVLAAFLEPAGHSVVFVENGIEAIEAWSSGLWDVILMDVQMPVMDGVTAAASIRQREQEEGRGHTPIIALTANVMSHQIDEYMADGMDAAVSKPIQSAFLLETIARLTAPPDSLALTGTD